MKLKIKKKNNKYGILLKYFIRKKYLLNPEFDEIIELDLNYFRVKKVESNNRIAKALRENINFIWISGRWLPILEQ